MVSSITETLYGIDQALDQGKWINTQLVGVTSDNRFVRFFKFLWGKITHKNPYKHIQASLVAANIKDLVMNNDLLEFSTVEFAENVLHKLAVRVQSSKKHPSSKSQMIQRHIETIRTKSLDMARSIDNEIKKAIETYKQNPSEEAYTEVKEKITSFKNYFPEEQHLSYFEEQKEISFTLENKLQSFHLDHLKYKLRNEISQYIHPVSVEEFANIKKNSQQLSIFSLEDYYPNTIALVDSILNDKTLVIKSFPSLTGYTYQALKLLKEELQKIFTTEDREAISEFWKASQAMIANYQTKLLTYAENLENLINSEYQKWLPNKEESQANQLKEKLDLLKKLVQGHSAFESRIEHSYQTFFEGRQLMADLNQAMGGSVPLLSLSRLHLSEFS